MKLNNDRLNAFSQVATDRNFNKAAAHLCITQSALSQRITKLEQEIETTLLVRSTDGITLTEAGAILFEYVRDLQYREQEVINRMTGRNNAARGILRIASFSSVLRSVIMPILRPIIHNTPDVFVEFFSRELRELPTLLASGEADFVVSDDSFNVSNAKKIKAVTLGFEEQVHIRCKHTPALSPPTFLDHDPEDMTTYHFFAAQGQPDIDIQRSFYDDVYGILEGVQLGFGEAILSAHLLDSQASIDIISHPKQVKTPVILYYQENRYLTQLQKNVITALTETAADYLQPRYRAE